MNTVPYFAPLETIFMHKFRMVWPNFSSKLQNSSNYFLLVDNTDEKEKISNKHDLIYDELISIIMDHQAVMM